MKSQLHQKYALTYTTNIKINETLEFRRNLNKFKKLTLGEIMLITLNASSVGISLS